MIYLLLYIFLTILSQVILKAQSKKVSSHGVKRYVFLILTNPYVLFAYSLTAVNIILWLYVLTKMSILQASFFSSIIFVLMVFTDHFIFHEPLTLKRLAGALCITGGICLLLL